MKILIYRIHSHFKGKIYNDLILGKALPLMKKNFPEAKVTETNAGHFLQEEVSVEIANPLKRVIDEVI